MLLYILWNGFVSLYLSQDCPSLCWVCRSKLIPKCVFVNDTHSLYEQATRASIHFFPRLRFRVIHGGQLLNGLAGPTIMSAGPYLSTTWFAPDQRATATAVASLFCYLGGAASFVVGPLVVPAANETLMANTNTAPLSDSFIRDRIQLVMYAGTISEWEPVRAITGSTAHHSHIRQRGSKNVFTNTRKLQ